MFCNQLRNATWPFHLGQWLHYPWEQLSLHNYILHQPGRVWNDISPNGAIHHLLHHKHLYENAWKCSHGLFNLSKYDICCPPNLPIYHNNITCFFLNMFCNFLSFSSSSSIFSLMLYWLLPSLWRLLLSSLISFPCLLCYQWFLAINTSMTFIKKIVICCLD